MKKCHGLACNATRLINAHIIPRAFARMHKNGSKKHNWQISLSRVKPAELGIFDQNILCEKCDGLLGRFDNYLYAVIRQFDLSKCPRIVGFFADKTVDCDIFCKGVLAILWRASISRRFPYSRLSLGKDEPIVQEILFGVRSLAEFKQLELLVQYYQSKHMGDKVKSFYTQPVQNQFNGLSGFSFGLNGFRISVKIDEQDFGPIFQPFVLNRQNIFRGLVVEFEETPEFGGMVDIAEADLQRRSIRKQRNARIGP